MNCWLVLVAQKSIGVLRLLAAAPALTNRVLQMPPSYARAVHFDPLFGESGIVNIPDVQMQAHEWAVHFVQKSPEFTRRNQKSLFRIAVLATNLHMRLGSRRPQLLHRLHAARIAFAEWNLFGHRSRYDQHP